MRFKDVLLSSENTAKIECFNYGKFVNHKGELNENAMNVTGFLFIAHIFDD